MFKTKMGLIGNVRLQIRGVDGVIRDDTGFMKNVITNTGLAELTGLLGNTGSKTAFTYLAVGTSSTAEAATQTALVAEITTGGLARAAATVSQVTTTVTDDTLQLAYTWTASATHAVEEIGMLNAASGGTMLGRKLTTTKNLISGEQLVATYQIISVGV